MTTLPAISGTPRPSRSAWALLVTAMLLQLPAAAQTAPPSGPSTVPGRPEDEPAPFIDRFDRVQFNNPSSSHYYNYPTPAEPEYHYFPPDPPPLETELRLLPPPAIGPPAPPELADFVGELFYPVLAARLATGDLPKSLRAQLQAYRGERRTLRDELRAQIALLKDVAAPVRERRLADLARDQSPRIVALENSAEMLRVELQPIGLLGPPPDNGGWNDSAVWFRPVGRDGAPAPAELRQEARATRTAAFFQDGFSPAQRRLLCEAALELDARVAATAPAARAGQEAWLLSFSPATARIRLLADLPAPLARRISDYLAHKSALKTELRDALRRNAGAGRAACAAAMRTLSSAQAPRLAELEAVAEEIRQALAALPEPPGPPAPPQLPPELTARITAYRAHKAELLKALYAMLTAGPEGDQGPASPVPPTVEPGSPWQPEGTAPTVVTPASLRVAPEEFNRRQAELVGQLNRELNGIREALADYGRSAKQPTDRKSINDLLQDFERARLRQEIWDRYRDYQTAALMPGLSPEQRRLLFAAALEELALPLPAGERVN